MTTAPAYDNSVGIGYARLSTRAQEHQAQLDALAAAHCREIITQTASTQGGRPKLREALGKLQAGDTLVIYKPDRVSEFVVIQRTIRTWQCLQDARGAGRAGRGQMISPAVSRWKGPMMIPVAVRRWQDGARWPSGWRARGSQGSAGVPMSGGVMYGRTEHEWQELEQAGWDSLKARARKSERIKAELGKRGAGKPVGRQPGSKASKARKCSGCVAAWEHGGARREAADRRREQP